MRLERRRFGAAGMLLLDCDCRLLLDVTDWLLDMTIV